MYNLYEALSGWGSGKVFLDIIFKIQGNMLKIDMLFIVYTNRFLQKKCVFSSGKTFYIDWGSFLIA